MAKRIRTLWGILETYYPETLEATKRIVLNLTSILWPVIIVYTVGLQLTSEATSILYGGLIILAIFGGALLYEVGWGDIIDELSLFG